MFVSKSILVGGGSALLFLGLVSKFVSGGHCCRVVALSLGGSLLVLHFSCTFETNKIDGGKFARSLMIYSISRTSTLGSLVEQTFETSIKRKARPGKKTVIFGCSFQSIEHFCFVIGELWFHVEV